eukprot:CAMPEP_0183324914 /NCGR_PEP_ID=MMETSP0160_2-20130417/78343_1 /TAXON_ID=2839 ORGANISM="Odontella Sinensis, Strain Grunow 1884" /NCGR_SAMPLE_ID=MMETSP0160_2 /ASSEMBLY_ACC=CAM_ASM_000250 /LENGTH=203 /DNA_ID=CAMNT_0025492607 /DNA_START=110 /DNA_END=718 /DNA_ORIENTATION=+
MDSYDSDEEFLVRRNAKEYVNAMVEFQETRSMWRDRIPLFSTLTFQQKHSVIEPYQSILYGLKERPTHLRFDKSTEFENELELFCDAIVIAWRLLPDCWLGLLMMLDYLAESTLSSDLQRIPSVSKPALVVIREIANNKNWPNNPMCGPMMYAGQAKTLLARITRGSEFYDCTTVSSVRAMNLVSGGGQPPRKASRFNLDRRR